MTTELHAFCDSFDLVIATQMSVSSPTLSVMSMSSTMAAIAAAC